MNLKYLNKITKRILGIVAVLVIVAAVVFNVSLAKPSSSMSSLMLSNVEALAQNEYNDWEILTFGYKCSDGREGVLKVNK